MSNQNPSIPEPEVMEANELEKIIGATTIEKFIQIISNTETEKLKRAIILIQEELARREQAELSKLLEMFKSLSPEHQQIFLSKTQITIPSTEESRPVIEKKEKNFLRMYQDFPPDNPKYKIAPLVNVEANEVFTGGNPKNKAWLADLSSEERYEQYGTLKKLEINPDYLEVYMTVPKAVFELVNDQWVDCSQA